MKIKRQIAKTPEWGFEDIGEIDDLLMPIIEIEDYKGDYDRDLKIEFRGEVDYSELMDVCDSFDTVIQKYDKSAYFEPVQPGIAEAFISLTDVEACTQVTASDEIITLDDVRSIIDGYGDKYFEAIPTAHGNDSLMLVIFDVGSYKIQLMNNTIVMTSIDDPNDDVRVFRTLYELRNFLKRQIAIGKQATDMTYSVNSSSSTSSASSIKATSKNKYCIQFKIGDEVRFNHGGGQYSDEVATISGYDKDGFYKVTWEDGSTSEGLSDAQLVYEYEDDIEMSTEIKAYTFDETEDGQGTDVRGVLDLPFARAEDLMYEVRNTIRGAYTDCESVEDLADFIHQLASEFEEAADEIESL